jgi:hypothetical protein
MDQRNTIDLLCQLSQVNNLQQLCDLTYQILGNPVFISDMAHTILAYTKCVEVDDPVWRFNVVDSHLDRNTLKQNRQVGSVHVNSKESQTPVLVNDDFQPYPRIIKTLIHEQRSVGVLVLTAYLKPLGPQDLQLVELISSFALPCLMRECYHITDDKHTVENYFIKLLEGYAQSPDQVRKRLEVLGYQSKAVTYVIALCNSDADDEHTYGSLDQMKAELAELLQCRVLLFNSLLLCIYGCDEPINQWPEQVPGLEEFLERWGLIAGVSRQMNGLEQLQDRYLQAQAVLEKGRLLERRHRCYRFDSLSSYLLFDRIEERELAKYCHEQIQQLWNYDQAHGSELCPTLQVYLEQAKSLAKTSEILYIHRNTVRYRINRCMELLGNRLEDGNEIFAYILSLRILEYETKICRTAGQGW